MVFPIGTLRHCLSALLLLFAGTARAAAYQPQLDQPGKDVVWAPTPDALVNTMLDLARVTARDYVIDLGSGDGRLVIMAAKRGARAHGIEYDSKLVAYAQRAAKQAGLAGQATFAQADLFTSDFSQATVVTLFLGPDLNRKLSPKLLALKPGTRIVSNTHPIGDWPADEKAQSRDDERSVFYRAALMWIVPAKVAGIWRSPHGRFEFSQRYQSVQGVMRINGKTVSLSAATLRGDTLRFSVDEARYTAVVKGNVIEGTVTNGAVTQPWQAVRAKLEK